MASSLAPEWFRVRVEKELITPPIQLLCFENISPRGRMNFHDGFNCLFSRLDPFLVLSSELRCYVLSVDMGKIFRLTGRSAVCGFHGIRILGSAPGGGGRSNRDGLGRLP